MALIKKNCRFEDTMKCIKKILIDETLWNKKQTLSKPQDLPGALTDDKKL